MSDTGTAVGDGNVTTSVRFGRPIDTMGRDELIECAALGIADEENWPHGKPNPTERERVFAERALRAIGAIS